MNYHLTRLANGLRVMAIPMPSVESATITVWVQTGSRNETLKNNGLSHFMEHMAFKGGQKYTTAAAVAEAIDSLGAENNAGTEKEWTNFWLKVRAEKIEKAFEILADMILTPQLREGDIAREKGVILEEISLTRDTPTRYVFDLFEGLIFKNSSLGQDILGTRESVSQLTRKDFFNYCQKHYLGQKMLITVAGGVTSKQISRLAKKYFGSLSKGSVSKTKTAKFTQKRPQILLYYKKTDQAHLALGFRGDKRGHKERYVETLLSAILGGSMSSRMFNEVREKRGLAYAVKTGSAHYQDNGYLQTYAGVPLRKINEAIKVILEQHYQISNQTLPVSDSELSKAKELVKGRLALYLEDTASVNDFFGLEELLLAKTRTPDEVYAEIDKVAIKDISRLGKRFFKPEHLNLAIIGPYKSRSRFEKLLHLV